MRSLGKSKNANCWRRIEYCHQHLGHKLNRVSNLSQTNGVWFKRCATIEQVFWTKWSTLLLAVSPLTNMPALSLFFDCHMWNWVKRLLCRSRNSCAYIYNRRDLQRLLHIVRDLISTITIQEIWSICTTIWTGLQQLQDEYKNVHAQEYYIGISTSPFNQTCLSWDCAEKFLAALLWEV